MPCRMMPRPTSQIVVNITASADNVVLHTLAGSPAGVVDVLCTISAGVTVGSTSTGTAAFRTGAFASGSTVRIVNNGRIAGKGGDGGDGATLASPDGGNGSAGGDAVNLACNVEIDNTSGEIFGGGGGGGGGAAGTSPGAPNGGGGGGGGQGDEGGDKGVALSSGSDGTDGGPSGAGNGGNGAASGSKGGKGGSWGSKGSKGSGKASDNPPVAGDGGAGGDPGKAVDLNGNTVTWLGGNNATQVKGSVS